GKDRLLDAGRDVELVMQRGELLVLHDRKLERRNLALQLCIKPRILERDGDAAGERIEELEVVRRERAAAAPVANLHDADRTARGRERRAQQASRRRVRMSVDGRIE